MRAGEKTKTNRFQQKTVHPHMEHNQCSSVSLALLTPVPVYKFRSSCKQ